MYFREKCLFHRRITERRETWGLDVAKTTLRD